MGLGFLGFPTGMDRIQRTAHAWKRGRSMLKGFYGLRVYIGFMGLGFIGFLRDQALRLLRSPGCMILQAHAISQPGNLKNDVRNKAGQSVPKPECAPLYKRP